MLLVDCVDDEMIELGEIEAEVEQIRERTGLAFLTTENA